jgi:hypothetical protein
MTEKTAGRGPGEQCEDFDSGLTVLNILARNEGGRVEISYDSLSLLGSFPGGITASVAIRCRLGQA